MNLHESMFTTVTLESMLNLSKLWKQIYSKQGINVLNTKHKEWETAKVMYTLWQLQMEIIY